MFVFRKIWRVSFSRNTRLEIRPLVLLPTTLPRLSPKFKRIANFLNKNKHGDLTLTKEDGNEQSEGLRMRRQSHVNTYGSGQNIGKRYKILKYHWVFCL